MKTESKRQIKFSNQLKKDLATIFQKDPSLYFNQALGTITDVKVSPDLGLARIYISIFPISQVEVVFENLENLKKDIRFKLSQKIGKQVRIIPELAFFNDNTEEEASKIDAIIDKLDIPPASKEE